MKSLALPYDTKFHAEIIYVRRAAHAGCMTCDLVFKSRTFRENETNLARLMDDVSFLTDYYQGALNNEEAYANHIDHMTISVTMEDTRTGAMYSVYAVVIERD